MPCVAMRLFTGAYPRTQGESRVRAVFRWRICRITDVARATRMAARVGGDGGVRSAREMRGASRIGGRIPRVCPCHSATVDAGHVSLRAVLCCDASSERVFRASSVFESRSARRRRQTSRAVSWSSRRARVRARLRPPATDERCHEPRTLPADISTRGLISGFGAQVTARRYNPGRQPANITPASACPGISDMPPVPRSLRW